ncbi:MAG: hypothetical protein QOF57_1217, partial [Frankiaceae bacterium]|nr:hypothetical protein [Frankiaceae bacterium]
IRTSQAERNVAAALLACVRFDADDEGMRGAVAAVDAAEFAGAAQFHGVASLVHHRLTAAQLPVDPALGASYREQLFRHLVAVADLREIGQALTDAGIAWLVFKGPMLATVYERDDLRSYSDVDVLVDRHQLAEALDVLYAAGCSQVDRNWPMIDAQTRGEMTLASRNGVSIDLHWAFICEPRTRLAVRVPVREMLARSVTRVVNEVPLPTLEPYDELAYVAMHAVMSGGHRLVWLVDMDRLVRSRRLDWDHVVRSARGSGLGLPLAIMLDRAHRYLGTDVPRSVIRRLAPLLGWRGVMGAVDAVRSPVGSFAGGMSGRIFAQAFRGTSPATAVGLAQELLDRRDRRNAPPMTTNPLHEDVPDARAREQFLSRVMSDAAV